MNLMKISKVYKIEGNVTVLMFSSNDSNRVINSINETISVDPDEYAKIYVIDNDYNTVLELHEFFDESVASAVGVGGESSKVGSLDLDVTGALFKGLLGSKVVKSVSKGNDNVSMNISRK